MTERLDAERSNLDFAGFAQEFLRRSPAYRADYTAMAERSPMAQEIMARAWGLAFPMRT